MLDPQLAKFGLRAERRDTSERTIPELAREVAPRQLRHQLQAQ